MLLYTVICSIFSTIFAIFGPKFLGDATNIIVDCFSKNNGVMDYNQLGIALATALGLYIASALFTYATQQMGVVYSQRISFSLRKKLSIKVNKLKFSYFENNQIGDILSRFTNDVDLIGQNLSNVITSTVTAVMTLVGIAIVMFVINPLLATVICIIIPVSGVAVFIIVKISQKHFNAQQEILGTVNGVVEDCYSGHEVLKSFQATTTANKELNYWNDKLYNAGYKSTFISRLIFPVIQTTSLLGYVVVICLGAFMTIGGIFTIGDIQAFIQYVNTFSKPLSQLSQVMNMAQQIAAASNRIFTFLDEPEVDDENEEIIAKAEHELKTSQVMALENKRETNDISFEHVDFSYTPGKKILDDFNVYIPYGKKVAIIGPTGTGKTTIMKLLMRFYEVDIGRITIDGVDIRFIDREHIRENIGIVMQDIWLFEGSIYDNIAFGNKNATLKKVKEAAKVAGADKFIEKLPGKYKFVVNESTENLSAGQLQLICIARAILADRDFLILDEATSAIDVTTEDRLKIAIDKLMKGKTVFIIAHRLSTTKNADIILVMREGKIIEQGNHDSLMKKNGLYAKMYNNQFGGA
ncbi:MAG: ABC transporter ATP-binding protein [Coriobacteriia bacterium]|nr:ABC transporter ATP-binding protein [Coriobacteriia bacterium]